jgi:hypothetical protein
VRKTLVAALLGVATLAALAPAAVSRPQPLAAPAAVGAAAKEPETLLGIVQRPQADGREQSVLVRVDPESLRPVAGPGLPLGIWGVSSWAFSPDRSRVAVVRHVEARGRSASALRIVDVGALRRELELPLGYRYAVALGWLEPDRIVAVLAGYAPARFELVTIAPSAKRIVSRVPLAGEVMNTGRIRDALVLLLAPENHIGEASLVVAYAGGDVRSVRLDRIWVGSEQPENAQASPFRGRRAGLALDPDGRRAYVFPPGSDAAKVDLDTLRVSYHSPSESVSLFGRLHDFLDPAAQAKAIEGPTRFARWLGGGLVAVTGIDYATWKDRNDNLQMRSTPAGLTVVDTRSWTARTIDRGASGAAFAEGLLLATGATCESERGGCAGMGLAAYGLDGDRRYRLFEGRVVWVWASPAFRGRAFVGMGDEDGEPMRLVEVASGRVLGERREPLPILLLADSSPHGE